MRSLVILFAGVFSFFYINLRLFRRTSRGDFSPAATSIEITDQKEKLKPKKRKYKNKKYKKKKDYQQKSYRLKGSYAKDKRYSNQRLLRRMYRND